MGLSDFLKWGIWLEWGFLFLVVSFAEVAQSLSLVGGGCERPAPPLLKLWRASFAKAMAGKVFVFFERVGIISARKSFNWGWWGEVVDGSG